MNRWICLALAGLGCARGPGLQRLGPPTGAIGHSAVAASGGSGAETAPTPAGATALKRDGSRWLSLYGASLRLPSTWRDLTEYSFTLPGAQKGHLDFGTGDELSAEFAAQRRSALAKMAETRPNVVVSELRTVATPLGDASCFDVVFGNDADAEVLALALVPHRPAWISLSLRGRRADLVALSAALATLQPLPQGALLAPAAAYAVLDVSFRWPSPLGLPQSLAFESEAGARLRVTWESQAPELSELDWHSQFSVPAEPPPELLRAEQGTAPTALVAAPRGFVEAPLRFDHVARVARAVAYQNQPVVLVFARAYARVGGRYLVLDYFDEAHQGSSLEAFYALLGTLHAQSGN